MAQDQVTTRESGWDFELQKTWAASLCGYWDAINAGETPRSEWAEEARQVAKAATYHQVRAIALYVLHLTTV